MAEQSPLVAAITGVADRTRTSIVTPALALVTALLLSGVVIAFSDVDTLGLWGSDPGSALSETLGNVGGAYRALFVGAFGSGQAISETLFAATPLILAGLAVSLGFQAGLFNIGVEGQMLIGGMTALYLGFTLDLPGPILVPTVLVGSMIGGGLWAGFAGWLRAKSGAHEVITTIMLNFIAAFLVQWLLKTSVFQEPGRSDPISKPIGDGARLGRLFGGDFRVTLGLIVALIAALFVGWLMNRTTIGFQFRTVGSNADAARYGGMSVTGLTISVMAASGALAGLAGANQIMSLPPHQAQVDFAGGIGFDAIALALVGRSKPGGVVLAGLMFGALTAGGRELQGAERIPVEIVSVIQGLIIVFIAAPALIGSLWRLRASDSDQSERITTGWST